MAAPNPPTQTTSSTPSQPLTINCHCGHIALTVPHKPAKLNECRCSICYKYGALWGYYQRGEVHVHHEPDLKKYIRADGDGDMSFNWCGKCSCVMFWCGEGEYAGPKEKMGVNFRMGPEEVGEGVERSIGRK